MITELLPGDPRQVGSYELTAVLGGGGMGRVFLGRSAGGRPVAVKVIRTELAGDPEFRVRFGREVAAARKVNGLYTALVVDADTDGPVPWLATAYVPGPSLAQQVAEHGPLPAEAVVTLAAGLAEGLAAIHAAGVVHRDLKPSNVLLAADGPRVIDFGISRAAEATSLTHTGFVIGSPGFMSPEQARGTEVGPPSDIFNLGAVLAYAATGSGPFGDGSTAALVYRVVHEPPSLDHLPDMIRPLAERCLTKDPALRPTASELLLQANTAPPEPGWLPRPVFTAYEEPHTVTAASQPAEPSVTSPPQADHQPAPRQQVPQSKQPRPSRRTLATALIITALLAASAATAFGLTSGHGTASLSRHQLAAAVSSRGTRSPASLESTPARSATPASHPATSHSAAPSRKPSTHPPVTQAPATPAPVTQPTTEAPVSRPSPTHAPVTKKPTPKPSPPSPSPSPTAAVLGGVDLNAWCQSQGYASAELVAQNAYGWKCVASNGTTAGIDVVLACRAQYNDPDAWAYYRNYNDPDSWYCTSKPE